jgi:hypothetical protein
MPCYKIFIELINFNFKFLKYIKLGLSSPKVRGFNFRVYQSELVLSEVQMFLFLGYLIPVAVLRDFKQWGKCESPHHL